jgi:rhamnulokinase
VDFGLLAADGSLVSLPRAYRDPRLDGAMEGFLEILPREQVYQLTGIQMIRLNTLYQLHAMVRDGWPLLRCATDLLMMPDLFNYLLTGEKRAEFTIATTSQLYNPRTGGWAGELFDALKLPLGMMQAVVQPGTVVGRLDPAIGPPAADVGGLQVVATASHDTASAVGAVPSEGKDWAYISSGTWSVMGVESDRPIITDESLALNFSNEGGVNRTFRVLKNISGLWLVQQCRAAWAREKLYSYEELMARAAEAGGFDSIIEPDHVDFVNPPDMPAAIQEFCRRTGQPAPTGIADTLRCILVSLALKYRLVLEQLRRVYPHAINRIHVIGGGSRNELLCQLSADATGLPVLAGPAEATVIGNLLVQAIGLGYLASHQQLREVVRSSFEVKRYQPRDTGGWDSAYQRFRELQAV